MDLPGFSVRLSGRLGTGDTDVKSFNHQGHEGAQRSGTVDYREYGERVRALAFARNPNCGNSRTTHEQAL